jgi:hypothetical protein
MHRDTAIVEPEEMTAHDRSDARASSGTRGTAFRLGRSCVVNPAEALIRAAAAAAPYGVMRAQSDLSAASRQHTDFRLLSDDRFRLGDAAVSQEALKGLKYFVSQLKIIEANFVQVDRFERDPFPDSERLAPLYNYDDEPRFLRRIRRLNAHPVDFGTYYYIILALLQPAL